jgi:hypothetical protein
MSLVGSNPTLSASAEPGRLLAARIAFAPEAAARRRPARRGAGVADQARLEIV